MDLGSTTPPLGMSKEGEMPEYLLNSKMLNLSQLSRDWGKSLLVSSAAVNRFCSFLIQTLWSPKLQMGDTWLNAACY